VRENEREKRREEGKREREAESLGLVSEKQESKTAVFWY
jgi:hypothetical protein